VYEKIPNFLLLFYFVDKTATATGEFKTWKEIRAAEEE